MGQLIVPDGGLLVKDPLDVKVYTVDWGTSNLAAGASIAASTFEVTPSSGSPAAPGDLVVEDESIAAGGRATTVQLSGGTLGETYEVSNTIVTDETPAQTKNRAFLVLVENL